MSKTTLWLVIFFSTMIGGLLFSDFSGKDFQSYYQTEIIIGSAIFFYLCEIIYFFKWHKIPFLFKKSKGNKPYSLSDKIRTFVLIVTAPILTAIFFTLSFGVVYTGIFGHYEPPYLVKIINKEQRDYIRKKQSAYYKLYVTNAQTVEVLDLGKDFYNKTRINDQLLIKKKVSLLGSYIDDDDVQIIHQRN